MVGGLRSVSSIYNKGSHAAKDSGRGRGRGQGRGRGKGASMSRSPIAEASVGLEGEAGLERRVLRGHRHM